MLTTYLSADRLCERGRLYIRKFYNGDDEALDQELLRVKRKDEDQLRAIRERDFGTGMHQKGKRERDMEKEHLDEVKRRQKDYAFGKIKKAFYGDDGVARNPWSESVAETMFWM
jgi:eukaryotic translation initiation factor 2C